MLPLPRTPMPVLLWYYGNSDCRTERLKIIKRTDEQDEQERLCEEREAGKQTEGTQPRGHQDIGQLKILWSGKVTFQWKNTTQRDTNLAWNTKQSVVLM